MRDARICAGRVIILYSCRIEGIQSNMVTVASAQPHAGPGGRIISLSLSAGGLPPAVYRIYPRVERVDFSPSSFSISDSRATTPRTSLPRISIYSRQPRANRRNDNWQQAPFFRRAKAKADYAAIIAPALSPFPCLFLSSRCKLFVRLFIFSNRKIVSLSW